MRNAILVAVLLSCVPAHGHWIPGETEDANKHNTLTNHESWGKCCPAPEAQPVSIPMEPKTNHDKRDEKIILAVATVLGLFCLWVFIECFILDR